MAHTVTLNNIEDIAWFKRKILETIWDNVCIQLNKIHHKGLVVRHFNLEMLHMISLTVAVTFMRHFLHQSYCWLRKAFFVCIRICCFHTCFLKVLFLECCAHLTWLLTKTLTIANITQNVPLCKFCITDVCVSNFHSIPDGWQCCCTKVDLNLPLNVLFCRALCWDKTQSLSH